MTVVPPLMLVKLFGVPEFVTLPAKCGETTTFAAHGKDWQCKKLKRSVYFLAESPAGRGRFGTAEEIADDIGRVLESGALPQAAKSWA